MLVTILKVLGLSVFLSITIKYGAPFLSVAATPLHAWIAVLVPPILMAIALVWRWQTTETHRPLGK
jgi:hypothetical protein